jgi:hypothetical protein
VAEREATLDEVYGWFRDDVATSFAFLVDDYGFRRTSTRDEGRDGIFTRFRNDTTAVEVAYEPTDEGIEIFLIKLEGGKVPAYADSWQRNWVPLFRYLDHVGASDTEGPNAVRWGDRDALREALRRHAEALREHGEAPLTGDFDAFDDARPPPISEDQLYDVGEPSDPWVGEEELREARSFPVQLGAWVARRLGRLVRSD